MSAQRYPSSILWSPIPLVSWLFPFIGHMGISYSNGVTLDFAGPYTVNVDHMLFGAPTRYLPLDKLKKSSGVLRGKSQEELQQLYDEALNASKQQYRTTNYTLVTESCHNLVGHSLQVLQIRQDKLSTIYLIADRTACNVWFTISLMQAALIFVRGRYCGVVGFVKTWLPFLIVAAVAVVFGTWITVISWVTMLLVFILIFAFGDCARPNRGQQFPQPGT